MADATSLTAPFRFSPRPNHAAEIHWREWTDEAFQRARAEGQPVLLSLSAVWCHWCHVMDETSYSDPRIIELINREFVPIRVDNDKRPDVNLRYNQGGWPTTAILSPDGELLAGATYVPPEQMLGWLLHLSDYYRKNRDDIAGMVAQLAEERPHANGLEAGAGPLEMGIVEGVLGSIRQAYDPEFGGLGRQPKFPHTEAWLLVAERFAQDHDPELGQMLTTTLDQMAQGGMYDHVEAGFFRYATTRDWSVPHARRCWKITLACWPCTPSAGG